jgi:ligand-binding sensor domain-containing protein
MGNAQKILQALIIPGGHYFQFPPSYFAIQPEYVQYHVGSSSTLWFSVAANYNSDASDGVFTLRDNRITRQKEPFVPWFTYNEMVWGRGRDGLYIYDAFTWHRVKALPTSIPLSYAIDRNNNLWITFSSHGVWSTTIGDAWKENEIHQKNSQEYFSFVSMSPQGELWMTSTHSKTKQSSIYRYENEGWALFPLSANMSRFKNVGPLHFTQSGEIWVVSTNNGIWQFRSSQWKHFQGGQGERPTTLRGRGITGFCIDLQDKVWVATHNGISCFYNNQWNTVLISPLSANKEKTRYVWDIPMASFYLDRTSTLWIGTQTRAHLGCIDVMLPFLDVSGTKLVDFITGEEWNKSE